MQEIIDIVIEVILKSFQGMILAWSGTVLNIPDGWAMCDGTQGTPDLHNKFIKGTVAPGQAGTTGGSGTHVHTFTGDGHQHSLTGGGGVAGGPNISSATTTVPASGTTNLTDGQPPWFKLIYIMKL